MTPRRNAPPRFGGLSTRIRQHLPDSPVIMAMECHCRNALGRLYNRLNDRRTHAQPNTSQLRYDEAQGRYYGFAEDVVWQFGRVMRGPAYQQRIEEFQSARRDVPETPVAVFLLPTFQNNGGTISVVNLVNDLIELGVDARIVVLSPFGYHQHGKLLTEPIFFRDNRDLVLHFPAADIVVATFWTTMYIAAAIFERRPSFVPAYFVQDFEPWFYPSDAKTYRRFAQDSYQLTPYCFAKTPWLCGKIRDTGAVAHEVPPALDLELFAPVGQAESPKPIVLTMLRPSTPQRGFETARQVLLRLSKARPDVAIHTFGASPGELESHDLEFPVTNHGEVPNDQLPELYRHAWVYADFSDFHGFGRTAAEAMACGTPCVLTDSGGVGSFAIHERNALIAPPGDVDNLVEHLLRILDDPSLRRALAGQCRPSVTHFDRKLSARRTWDLFQDWMTGPCKGN